MGETSKKEDGQVSVIEKDKVWVPKYYKVIMHNDDYTTMEFVVYILKKYFQKKGNEAQQIMLEIHTRGAAVCGVYSLEIAETKVKQVSNEAKKEQFPLRVTLEEE